MSPTRMLDAPADVTADAPQTTTATAAERPERARSAVGCTILVATDGSRGADAALRIGTGLARRDGAEPQVVSVYQPLPAFDPELSPRLAEVDRALERELAVRVTQQVERIRLDLAPCCCEIAGGPVAESIAHEAVARGAELIVLGTGRHGALELVTGRETALDVIRAASVPVLAVPTAETALPRRIVVATDFSASSDSALRAAVRLVGRRGVIYLVHVMPRLNRVLAASWEATQRQDACKALEGLAATLAVPEAVRVERAVLVGDPAQELLTFAASVEANAIATGSHGYTGMARALLGSVSTQLLRKAPCAVLVAPPQGDAR